MEGINALLQQSCWYLTPTRTSRFATTVASSGVAANPKAMSFSTIALPEQLTGGADVSVGQKICRTHHAP